MNRNYIYAHIYPETNEIFYIGRGTGQRAWTTLKQHRSMGHYTFLEELMDKGYVPSEWAVVVAKNMGFKESVQLETNLIDHFSPTFNAKLGSKLLKLSQEQLEHAKERRNNGEFYNVIAGDLGVSTMTLHRALNGGSKRYTEVLNDY